MDRRKGVQGKIQQRSRKGKPITTSKKPNIIHLDNGDRNTMWLRRISLSLDKLMVAVNNIDCSTRKHSGWFDRDVSKVSPIKKDSISYNGGT